MDIDQVSDLVVGFLSAHIWDITVGAAFMLLGIVFQGLGERLARGGRGA